MLFRSPGNVTKVVVNGNWYITGALYSVGGDGYPPSYCADAVVQIKVDGVAQSTSLTAYFVDTGQQVISGAFSINVAVSSGVHTIGVLITFPAIPSYNVVYGGTGSATITGITATLSSATILSTGYVNYIAIGE